MIKQTKYKKGEYVYVQRNAYPFYAGDRLTVVEDFDSTLDEYVKVNNLNESPTHGNTHLDIMLLTPALFDPYEPEITITVKEYEELKAKPTVIEPTPKIEVLYPPAKILTCYQGSISTQLKIGDSFIQVELFQNEHAEVHLTAWKVLDENEN